jgi:hypothetical protein
MCIVTIVAALITISCPQPMSPAEAAGILPSAPGLSNRTNVYPIPDLPRAVFLPPAPSTATPIEPRRLDGTPLSQPPQVHGIPYPWTPLTWAILHSGATRSR